MRVAQISFFSDPRARMPERLLQDWPSLADVAECARRAGVRVHVIQACPHSQHWVRDGVNYHFLPFGDSHPAGGPAGCFGKLLRTIAPDILHVHGLDFARDVLSLAAAAPGIPILLQDHASRLPRPWRRTLWRRGFSAASGIAFCSLEQAQPFAAAGLISRRTKVYEIPESTSRFTPGDKDQARRSLGVSGDPLVLWVGHLDANKDPLTVLEGIGRAARELPRLQLYCCYGIAPLLRAVRRRMSEDPHLSGRVHLLGRIPHALVEQLMSAADIFVSGSHREGSGYALIEALACGLPPVVTDIPSFCSLTGAGSVGALWPSGDAGALCNSLLSVAARPRAQMRAAARDRFDNELSFGAVGRKLASIYQDLLERRHRSCVAAGGRLEAVVDHV
ncbi:MAG TPA: glycosyltransferase family 4 protein [Steroidobacteraceae bacterium]|nr:glycosyltransferase family 4 protein [Steroidobacteraceae bacterium]